ncbi:hypothetical protein [Dyadobacter luticola]|uniref:hypothetical protein n=1 Tax=Dyadobacter luticola TaxID=1979387 RepID=UPI00197AAAA3|nr:hypothetical protein [Dyadobacter luticola]
MLAAILLSEKQVGWKAIFRCEIHQLTSANALLVSEPLLVIRELLFMIFKLNGLNCFYIFVSHLEGCEKDKLSKPILEKYNFLTKNIRLGYLE